MTLLANYMERTIHSYYLHWNLHCNAYLILWLAPGVLGVVLQARAKVALKWQTNLNSICFLGLSYYIKLLNYNWIGTPDIWILTVKCIEVSVYRGTGRPGRA